MAYNYLINAHPESFQTGISGIGEHIKLQVNTENY